jgi:hypothetical protein
MAVHGGGHVLTRITDDTKSHDQSSRKALLGMYGPPDEAPGPHSEKRISRDAASEQPVPHRARITSAWRSQNVDRVQLAPTSATLVHPYPVL